MKKDTTETDRLLAEYEGWVDSGDTTYLEYGMGPWKVYTKDNRKRVIEQATYSTSWDALMPVVKKCLKELRDIQNKTKYGDDMEEVHIVRIEMALNQLEIDKLYNEVISAITWINENKK